MPFCCFQNQNNEPKQTHQETYPPIPWSEWLRRLDCTPLKVLGLLGIPLLLFGFIFGLAYGLTHRHLAAIGAANATGIVALDDGRNISTIFAYFVDVDNNVRRANYTNGNWTGGTTDDKVKIPDVGVRPGSPVMALSYAYRGELVWRFFYIDNKGILQERLNTNLTRTSGWTDGYLGNDNYIAAPSYTTGLTACWSDQWFGENNTAGIRLFYGAREGGVQELKWTYGAVSWRLGEHFPDASNEAGCECTSRSLSVLNLWTISKSATVKADGTPMRSLQHHFVEFNSSVTRRRTNTWTTSNVTYDGIYSSSALTAKTAGEAPGADRLVTVQLSNGTVRQLVVGGFAETSTVTDAYFDVSFRDKQSKPKLGTKLASVVLFTKVQSGREVHVLFEPDPKTLDEEGHDGAKGRFVGRIVDASRNLDGQSWSKDRVPIP